MSTLTSQDYCSTITAKNSPKDIYDKISTVSSWWSTNFEGNATHLGDIFTVRFKNGDWYKIKIDELIPDKKIVWNVIDADQTWHDNRKEWIGTKIIWEISPENNGSRVDMTQLGLTPDLECYDRCKKGWDFLVNESLAKYLAEGAGMPV
jgi:hypothetical protein